MPISFKDCRMNVPTVFLTETVKELAFQHAIATLRSIINHTGKRKQNPKIGSPKSKINLCRRSRGWSLQGAINRIGIWVFNVRACISPTVVAMLAAFLLTSPDSNSRQLYSRIRMPRVNLAEIGGRRGLSFIRRFHILPS